MSTTTPGITVLVPRRRAGSVVPNPKPGLTVPVPSVGSTVPTLRPGFTVPLTSVGSVVPTPRPGPAMPSTSPGKMKSSVRSKLTPSSPLGTRQLCPVIPIYTATQMSQSSTTLFPDSLTKHITLDRRTRGPISKY